ncbi:MAG: serine O-acetyltransferase EpsC [Armatimonadota bacterium]
MFRSVRRQIRAVKERDPAARGVLEILLCYPGVHAVVAHRLIHWLWNHRLKTLARFLSQVVRWFTLIEIHPGARIGEGLFIDHGAGLVIGETAEIGDNCNLFHGVTLGGTGKETGKRHPTLEDNVTIAAHAQILGSITIGENSVVGAGAVVLDSVPPNCTVVGVKARVVRREGKRVYDFRHDQLPAPDEVALECLLDVVRSLTVKTRQLEAAEGNFAQTLEEVVAARDALQDELSKMKLQHELDQKAIERLSSMEGRLRELQQHVRDLEEQIAERTTAGVR